MRAEISKWVNLNSCSLNSIDFADKCRQKLSEAARMTFFGRLN